MRRKICLAPELANLLRLETFIRACPFPRDADASRALLVATEYFDNIARYGKMLLPLPVCVTVSSARGRARIVIGYSTKNFAEMTGAAEITKPHYDEGSLRYRGLGLRMCRNLASSIRYRTLLFKSYIIIIL